MINSYILRWTIPFSLKRFPQEIVVTYADIQPGSQQLVYPQNQAHGLRKTISTVL